MKVAAYLRSSVGQKQLMALTGLGLALFVLLHMIGNMLIFAGAEIYNQYSHALITSPILYPAEIGLVALFVIHLFLAIRITRQNRAARPHGYAVQARGEKATCLGRRTLAAQGALIAAFVVLHLISFKYGPVYEVRYDGVTVRDLYRLVVEVFHDPRYVAWYVVALCLLGVHLRHGMQALWQSLGLVNERWRATCSRIALAYALIVTAGFISQPVYVYFFVGHS